MKVKGMKKFEKIINEFTQTFGVTAYWNPAFEALPAQKIIGFTVVVDGDMNECFLNDAEVRFPEVHASLFLWLLMHEIGHCMTDHLWTPDDETYFKKAKKHLDKAFGEDVIRKNNWYHKIGDEYMATKWAGEYMIAHPKKMAKFNKKLNEAMKVFCKKNGITS